MFHLAIVLLSGFLAISSTGMLSRSNGNADCSLRTPDNTKEQTSSFDSAVPRASQVVVDTPARLGNSNAKLNDESIDQTTTTVDTANVNNVYTASSDNNQLTDLHRLTSAIYDQSPETTVWEWLPTNPVASSLDGTQIEIGGPPPGGGGPPSGDSTTAVYMPPPSGGGPSSGDSTETLNEYNGVCTNDGTTSSTSTSSTSTSSTSTTSTPTAPSDVSSDNNGNTLSTSTSPTPTALAIMDTNSNVITPTTYSVSFGEGELGISLLEAKVEDAVRVTEISINSQAFSLGLIHPGDTLIRIGDVVIESMADVSKQLNCQRRRPITFTFKIGTVDLDNYPIGVRSRKRLYIMNKRKDEYTKLSKFDKQQYDKKIESDWNKLDDTQKKEQTQALIAEESERFNADMEIYLQNGNRRKKK